LINNVGTNSRNGEGRAAKLGGEGGSHVTHKKKMAKGRNRGIITFTQREVDQLRGRQHSGPLWPVFLYEARSQPKKGQTTPSRHEGPAGTPEGVQGASQGCRKLTGWQREDSIAKDLLMGAPGGEPQKGKLH